MVAAPEPDAVREAGFFVERLQAEGMPLAGVVVNRATTSTEAALDARRAAVAAAEAAEGPTEPPVHDGTAEVLWVHARRVRRLEAEREVAARLTRLVPAGAHRARPGPPARRHRPRRAARGRRGPGRRDRSSAPRTATR